MIQKPFKTHEEQIELLKSRGIDFSGLDAESCAIDYFSRVGYYRLINGYNRPFLDKSSLTQADDDKYRKGTTLKEIYALYVFDDMLRELVLKYTLKIETHVKSLLAYRISEQYGHENYLRYANFDTSKNIGYNDVVNAISEIHKTISSRISDPSINHYLTKYGYVPLWVLNNSLTFGTISKLYSIMKVPDRQYVSKQFMIPDSQLGNFLIYLTKVRNTAAHSNRLYCMRNKRPIVDTPIHAAMNIAKNSKGDEYIYGKRDFFATVIIFRYLLSNNDFKKFISQLKFILDSLNKRLNSIHISVIKEIMGLPNDWYKIPKKQSAKGPSKCKDCLSEVDD